MFVNILNYLGLYTVSLILIHKPTMVHRTIVGKGLALLTQASLPLSFWEQVFHTSFYLSNRISLLFFTISLIIKFSTTKYRIISFSKYLVVFASPIYVHTMTTNSNFVFSLASFLAIVRSKHKGYCC